MVMMMMLLLVMLLLLLMMMIAQGKQCLMLATREDSRIILRATMPWHRTVLSVKCHFIQIEHFAKNLDISDDITWRCHQRAPRQIPC
jgi:hypothetical protein